MLTATRCHCSCALSGGSEDSPKPAVGRPVSTEPRASNTAWPVLYLPPPARPPLPGGSRGGCSPFACFSDLRGARPTPPAHAQPLCSHLTALRKECPGKGVPQKPPETHTPLLLHRNKSCHHSLPTAKAPTRESTMTTLRPAAQQDTPGQCSPGLWGWKGRGASHAHPQRPQGATSEDQHSRLRSETSRAARSLPKRTSPGLLELVFLCGSCLGRDSTQRLGSR